MSITPNSQDCMGVRGIARDLAAAGLGTLKPLGEVYRMGASIAPIPGDGPAPDVRTDDSEGCPAFFAQAVSGVINGVSPAWMSQKLTAIGQKPISALVDITNFVSVDLGRPLHVYDRATLTGGLVARRARDGEQVLALNGKTYTLDATMTVIADEAAVHDIGGIMGGEHSGVSETTTDVIIECAYFDPDHIARTGQKLGLTSDARTRFERGVDPAFLDDGLAIATWLVLELCGGKPSGITRAGTPPATPRTIAYDPARAEKLGGLAIAPRAAKDDPRKPRLWGRCRLERLGAELAPRRRWLGRSGRGSHPHRRDRQGSGGAARPGAGVAKPTATPEQKLERRLRRTAAARGLNEAVTWSFISEAEAAAFGGGAWALANPISEDMKVMRPSLLPGLLSAAGRNLRRGAASVRLFEIGRRYLADAERPTLGVVLAGEGRPRGWQQGKAVPFDAFDAKAEALALLEAAGAPVANLQVMGEAGEVWHPGQSGTLRLGPKTVLAAFGMVHPLTARAYDLDGPVAAVELYLDALPGKRAAGFMRPAYAPPALQVVRRDFAFLVPAALAADALVRAVKGADKAAITAVRLFDVFTGGGVEEGSKSLAIEVTLQPGEKSFTDEELKAVADKIVAAAAKLGASLRG